MSTRYGLAVLVALFVAAPAFAQESVAVISAKEHLRSLSAPSALSGADLDDLAATDSYLDRRTGATYVYLAQRHLGIPVHGAVASVAVQANGKTLGLSPRGFEVALASRVNATEPQIGGDAAVSLAESRVAALAPQEDRSRVQTLSDDPDADDAAGQPIVFEATAPQLVYQPTDGGEVRLVWHTTLTATSGAMQVWSVRVDALTGSILAMDDMVDRDRWHVEDAAPSVPSFAPVAAPQAAPAAVRGGASYRVLPYPVESPIHGEFELVTNPADAEASPLGWHDTGSQTFTTTRGNNIWAYPDRNDSESPDAEGVPEGGSDLTFDFVYDTDQHPRESVEAATVNLFYWGNITHDVTYQYGFDEASGNFQFNNFGNGGVGGDMARLEAQSGAQRCNDNPQDPSNFACYGNANFSTPGDGGSGRMQMYEWVGSPTLNVTSPSGIAGDKPVAPGLFGTPGDISGEVVAAETSAGETSEGCTAGDIANGAALSGKIALISRGTCPFTAKARSAEALGAIAVIVHNNNRELPESPEDLVRMAISPDEDDDISIPAVFVQRSVGRSLATQTEPVTLDLVQPPRRDSDLDVGVVVHEYGHGISNRLTGGPSASGCLRNGEQMGEGWSDYYGLMLTMTEASDTPRGIAPYLTFEGTDGQGIRPAPYARDFSVNDLTYQSVISGAGSTLSVPHGLGTVWATMLWDMTLDLTDALGFDEDVYDADGGSGNQVALNLVTTGMKLQPCSPGFVDGRDAILQADTLLYGGANSEIIWAAFARRGLGVNADQGSSENPNDGMADFTTPVVSNERGPNTDGAALAIAGPNPARSTTTLSLSLAAPETVTVRVMDLLGREVQTLHTGALAAGEAHRFEVNASGLAPGVYLVRASGDTFSATQRLTVVR